MALIKLVDTSGAKMADLGNGAFLGESLKSCSFHWEKLLKPMTPSLTGDIDASKDNKISGGFYVQHKSEKPLRWECSDQSTVADMPCWSSILLSHSYTYDCELFLSTLLLCVHGKTNPLYLKDDEIKIVLEGELHVKEPASGASIVAKVGDVLNISNGAALEFNSTDKARIFVSTP